MICLYCYSEDFWRSDGVLKRGLLDKLTTPSKSRKEGGVGKRDDLFDIPTPRISGGAGAPQIDQAERGSSEK